MLTPRAVGQILEVLSRTRRYHEQGYVVKDSYQQAVSEVAKAEDVAYQTIGDLCRRRMQLTRIYEFYNLLERWLNGNPEDLIALLKKNIPVSQHSRIDDFFGSRPDMENETSSEETLPETFTFQLNAKDARLLSALETLEGKPISEILSEQIPGFVRARIRMFTEG